MQVTNYGLGGLCEPHIGKKHKLMHWVFLKFLHLPFFRSHRIVGSEKDRTSV